MTNYYFCFRFLLTLMKYSYCLNKFIDCLKTLEKKPNVTSNSGIKVDLKSGKVSFVKLDKEGDETKVSEIVN